MQSMKTSLKTFMQSVLRSGSNNTRMVLVTVMLVLLVIVAARWGMSMYERYTANLQNQIDVQTTRYMSLSRLLSDADRYHQEHATLVKFKDEALDKGMITGSTPAMAEAQLQNMVDTLAEEAGLSVLSMRMLPRTSQGEITNLKIGINCRGEIGAIKEFLKSISSGEKYLFVDQVQIQVLNRRQHRYYNFNAEIIAWTES